MGTIREFLRRAKFPGPLLLLATICGGCQSADPLAAFGPYKVPPPTTAKVAPYYPPAAITTQQSPEKTTSSRMSVSVEMQPPPISPARLATDPTDRQPIRVVENPAASTRTAAATNRGTTSSGDTGSATPSTATAK